jgi:hypothetical protein
VHQHEEDEDDRDDHLQDREDHFHGLEGTRAGTLMRAVPALMRAVAPLDALQGRLQRFPRRGVSHALRELRTPLRLDASLAGTVRSALASGRPQSRPEAEGSQLHDYRTFTTACNGL